MRFLENTNAVIFLTSALQVLTQEERKLLQELITQLNNCDRNARNDRNYLEEDDRREIKLQQTKSKINRLFLISTLFYIYFINDL